MKAVRLTEVGRPLEADVVPVPEVGPGDVLVRIRAAGICHSDAHYRAGASFAGPLPITLGHEVAGVVEKVGPGTAANKPGDRVCLHYLVTCGACAWCARGFEQFCTQAKMIGKHRDGGYAEYIAVPARSIVPLPDSISFEHGAAMMCSSATSFHALRKARLQPRETVAVFGAGGLGLSAIQLALAMGALEVYAVDINPEKLRVAERLGAITVDASRGDAVRILQDLTGGSGVDVALELIGLHTTMQQSVRCLGAMGRAVIVGIGRRPFEIDAYSELVGKEAEVIGCSDHLLQEFPLLMEYAGNGQLSLGEVVTRRVPLDASAINEVLDSLERFSASARTVIIP
jgi:propanol-preferring alcohol dehydrogenase